MRMKTHTLYTREDCGCFADGSYGDGHVLSVAIELALDAGWNPDEDTIEAIETHCHLSYSDAADEAVEYLNEHCVGDGISFEFVDGDLLLIADEECE